MRNINRSLNVFLFLICCFYSSFSFSLDSTPLLSEQLSGDAVRVITPAGYSTAVRGGVLPHQPRFDEHTGLPLVHMVRDASEPPRAMTMDPSPRTHVMDSAGRSVPHTGHNFGGVDGGISGGDFSTHITQQLIDNSKFKREYESLQPELCRVLEANRFIIEFETLFKLYEANPSMAELYKENFQRLGNFVTRSGNYGHPLAKELAADIDVKSTKKNLGRQIGLYIATPYCLACAYSTINDEIEVYEKAIEEYQFCKGAYISGSPHIKQLDAKISTVRSYIEKSESRKCCVCCGCFGCLALFAAPFVAGAVITGMI